MAKKACTLIELLVVFAILSILAMIALPNLLEAQTRTKVGRAQADLATIAGALEMYRLDTNAYPHHFLWTVPQHTPRNFEASLTTPIGYLTSVPADVFIPPRGVYRFPGTSHYYTSAEQMIVADHTASPAFRERAKLHCYDLRSAGPDRDFEQLSIWNYSQQWGYSRMYDPTNGTISGGDIIRTRVLGSFN